MTHRVRPVTSFTGGCVGVPDTRVSKYPTHSGAPGWVGYGAEMLQAIEGASEPLAAQRCK